MATRSKGAQDAPTRVLICGVEGVGKSTLAAKAPRPLFFDVENGSNQLDVDRVSGFRDWQDLITELLSEITDTEHDTIVIDTVDAAEKLLTEKLLRQYKAAAIEEIGGYGKGYNVMGDAWLELMRTLNRLHESGKHIILISHVRITSVTMPDQMGSWSTYALKLSKQIASFVKEWADAMFFCRYVNTTVKDGTAVKIVGARRVLNTQHGNGWEAKNRYGLEPELPLEWDSIAPIFGAKKAETAKEKVLRMLKDPDKKPLIADKCKALGIGKPSMITDEIAEAIMKEME